MGLQYGVWIHAYMIKSGFESNISVVNTLLDVYAKCERIELARKVFDKMTERNVVSWTAIIAGYSQYGHANEALTHFYQMQEEDIEPEVITIASVLPACAHLAALQQGKCIHAYIIRRGIELDVPVCTALLTMYAKCGCIEVARQLFDKMAERDLVSWSAMITGYGMHGDGENALALFSQMQQIGMKPDNITFIGILSACSHAGLVDEGLRYFDCMSQDYSLTPGVEHYACMVDLMGRAGCLDEAHNLIKMMPIEPDDSVWGALLGACRIHSNIELGEFVSKRLLELEPKKVGNYVLLSNIYAAAGRWDDVMKVRSMLKDRGLKKIPGSSWIEIKNRVHSFSVGDKSHPQSEKIYTLLESLAEQMKKAGYVPDTSFVLHDVE
jgi:pentatricopeptide repeat protein